MNRETLNNIVAAYQEGIARQEVQNLPKTLKPNDYVICEPADQIERVAFTWFDRIFNQRDLTAVDDLVHPDCKLVAEGKDLIGRDAIRARLQAILDGFQPLELCVEHLVNDGRATVIYWQVNAVHSGNFFGIEPTGRSIFIRGSTLAIIRDGQFIEARDHWDAKQLLDQIS